MSDDNTFEYESYEDLKSIQTFLRTLSDAFEKGSVTLSSGEDTIQLTPGDLLKFRVYAKKKEKGNKLQIKISWQEAEDTTETKLSIGS